jgi:hypothetical protein
MIDSGFQRRKIDTCRKLCTIYHHDFNGHIEALGTDQICLLAKAGLCAYKSAMA